MKDKNDNIYRKLRLFRGLLIVAFFVLIIGVCVLFFCKMDDTVYAMGKLKGINDYSLRAMVAGRITEVCKQESDFVKKGDIILKIDVTPLHDQIVVLKNEISELEAELTVRKNYYEVLKNNPRPKEFTHAENELSEKNKEFEFTQKNLSVYKGLYNKKVISRLEYEKRELANAQSKIALEKARDDFRKVQNGMEEKILMQASAEIKLLQLKLDNRRKTLEITQQHVVDYTISAPEDGMVTELTLPSGVYVQKGDVIAKMSSIGQKKYLAYVSERHIYKIRSGQSVIINSRQYNYLNFGYFYGKVKQVYELPVKQDNVNYYPIEVMLTNEPYDLKLGSAAELRISTGRERIIVCLLGLNN
jgi:multidrug resistance efflux pump